MGLHNSRFDFSIISISQPSHGGEFMAEVVLAECPFVANE